MKAKRKQLRHTWSCRYVF